MRLSNFIKLALWVLLFEIIGFLLGLLTKTNIHPWYENLNKSFLTPPGTIFSMVWTFLYALLALIAWLLSNQHKESSKKINSIFTLQMMMNWCWTVLFFQFHWLSLSTIWLITLTCLNLILIIETKNKQKIIAFLLIPYLFWLAFATYLNAFIALMN